MPLEVGEGSDEGPAIGQAFQAEARVVARGIHGNRLLDLYQAKVARGMQRFGLRPSSSCQGISRWSRGLFPFVAVAATGPEPSASEPGS